MALVYAVRVNQEHTTIQGKLVKRQKKLEVLHKDAVIREDLDVHFELNTSFKYRAK